MRKTILIADTDDLVLSLCRGLFERIGCLVHVAQSSADALECLQSQVLDLVLVDVELPDLGGLDLLQRIRSDPVTVRVPVLLIGDVEDPDLPERCRAAGASDFVAKPLKLIDLIRTTGRLLSIPYRCPLRVPVKVALPGDAGPTWVAAEARDISNSGLLVATEVALPVGTPVSVELTLPGQEVSTTTPGMIRREVQAGEREYGISFFDVPDPVLEYIQSFLQGFPETA